MSSDHYQALDVSPYASREEIRAAYLRVMRDSHPDRARGDLGAAERARRANEAWEVLSDPDAREDYDQLRRSIAVEASPARPALSARVPSHPPAYSSEKVDFSEAFTRASLRVALAIFGVGLVLLLLTSG